MKFTQSILLSGILFSFQPAFAQKPPSWFELNSRTKLVQSKAKSDGVVTKTNLEKIDVRKIEMGAHKLNLVTARFGTSQSETEGGYNLSEIYSEPGSPPKLLLQLVDKTGCGSQVIEDVTVKKLGFINEIQIHFLQVQLLAPTCPNAVGNPKMFLVVQESKKGVEKVYQSEISESGKYRIAFQKDHIRLDYAKSLSSDSLAVDLVWNEKTQKFELGQP